MKRVYAMRGALLLLDYEEEATGPFRALLLQVSQRRRGRVKACERASRD